VLTQSPLRGESASLAQTTQRRLCAGMRRILLSFALCALAASPVLARVAGLTIETRTPLPDSAGAPAYERIEGVVRFETDPADASNRAITDLSLAPRNGRGLVESAARFVIVQPVDPATRSGVAFLEVPNRGGSGALRLIGAPPGDGSAPGDGLALRAGHTLAWVGWQWDVDKGDGRMWFDAPVAKGVRGAAVTGKMRADWVVRTPTAVLQLGHQDRPGPYPAAQAEAEDQILTRRTGRYDRREVVPRADWSFTEDGRAIRARETFAPGYIYELVYRAAEPRIAGLGLAAVRDFAAHLKAPDAPGPVKHVVGYGVSQSGRFLRHFLYQGFNRTEDDGPALDGAMILTAGAGRGSFNHRFAEPSRDAHAFSSFLYPTDLFPYASTPLPDPADANQRRGLLDTTPRALRPKIMQINTGYEYWQRAAALIHTDWRTGADLAPAPEERLYHLASSSHLIGRALPETVTGRGVNPIDHRPTVRALAMALGRWVAAGAEPPATRIPRRADGTLTPAPVVRYPDGEAAPLPHAADLMDFGPGWRQGRIEVEPGGVRASLMPEVPAVDAAGNELGGVRPVELAAPLLTYRPWSRFGSGAFADELSLFIGETAVLASRPDRAAYLAAVETAADQLIKDGFLLAEDKADVVARQAALWDRVNAAAIAPR